jgi:hypothetical protein
MRLVSLLLLAHHTKLQGMPHSFILTQSPSLLASLNQSP